MVIMSKYRLLIVVLSLKNNKKTAIRSHLIAENFKTYRLILRLVFQRLQ